MGDDQRVWNKKHDNRQEPENYVRGSGFYGRAEEFRDDDNENLGENEVAHAQFSAQNGTVRLNFGLGYSERRIGCGGQVRMEPGSRNRMQTISGLKSKIKVPI